MKTQKKKNNKESFRKIPDFKWTSQKKKAAFMLSTGTNSLPYIARELEITERTLFNWRQCPEFVEEIEKQTLKNENFTRAGLLRNCLKGMKIKESYIADDKNTYLDYIKQISDLQELTKQKLQVDGQIVVNLVRASCRKEDVRDIE